MADLIKTVISLRNMISQMSKKDLELQRITKTSALLLQSGLSKNSIPQEIIKRCLDEQRNDGGWIATVDTMWNTFFLLLFDDGAYQQNIAMGLEFIRSQKNNQGLWGRSKRDISRVPVTGILFYLFPELANRENLLLLEQLWISEQNSLTYKAGYILMAFKRTRYTPTQKHLIETTVEWLIQNQRNDGGFAPWRDHPVDSNVFCTSIATLGLLEYCDLVPVQIFKNALNWLLLNRLKTGIWKYHEIEDGSSWGLFTLSELSKYFILKNG